ncbi:MAG TPA: hypothetical protein VIU12_10615 [Chryseolinea sp.]
MSSHNLTSKRLTDLGLGIFNEFWDGVHPHYLPFLNLHDSNESNWNLTISIQRLNTIVEKHSEQSVQEGIRHLLTHPDWRPHLVACLVLLRLSPQARSTLLDLFWERLSLGSWVSPQISVAVSLVDRNFKMKGEKILSDGLAMNDPSLLAQDHHALPGPRRPYPPEGKTKAALEFLVHNVINDTSDNDAGGLHARDWKQTLLKLIDSKRIVSCEILQGTA